MIKIENVTKYIEKERVLDKINFDIKDGEIVGLLGPNGAGKTSLLNIVSGIWMPEAGNVFIDGANLAESADSIKQKIGYIPDKPFLYPKLTGREFLYFVGAFYSIKSDSIDKKIFELAAALEINAWLDKIMDTYPRGIEQKMTFAAMLLHSPGNILLDEPLTNLDPKSSKLVKELLVRKAGVGCAILLSTHILEIAEKLCHRVVVIHRGRQISQGTIAELQNEIKLPGLSLEGLFLELTGGEKYTELLKYIS